MSASGLDRRLFLDFAIAAGVNLLLLGLGALVLWPMGKAALAGQLVKGLGVFVIAIGLAVGVGSVIATLFRIEDDPPSTAYVILNLVASSALQTGWSAYAALAANRFAAGTSFGVAAAVHAVGFLASFFASMVVGAFYHGHLYKMVNAVLAIVAYVVFALTLSP